MGEPIAINKDYDIKLDSFVRNYFNPRYIFLPIKKKYKLRVTDNTYIYKNDIVMFDDFGKSIHSSISGKVLGVKDMLYYGNKVIPSLVIENDFKENIRVRKSAKRYLNSYDLKTFKELIDDNSLRYKGEYVLDKFEKKSKIFLINGVELEPYFGNNYFLLINNVDTILETVDLISGLYDFEKTIIVIKNNDSELVDKFLNQIGTYPNIEFRLVNDVYPIGKEKLLLKELKIDNAVTLTIEELVWIYNVLKKQAPVTEKIITISGNAVNPKSSINVKLGTLLSEVFINNFDFTEETVDVYLNGVMHGELVDTLKYVITSDIDGIIVNKKCENKEDVCLNCGLCLKHCPMGLNPKFVKENKDKIGDDYKDKCLKCGLCNYVCPSNRKLKQAMERKN